MMSSFVLHDNFFLYKSILCLTVLVLIDHDFRISSMYLDCRFVEFSLKAIYCAVEKGLEKHSGGYFSVALCQHLVLMVEMKIMQKNCKN